MLSPHKPNLAFCQQQNSAPEMCNGSIRLTNQSLEVSIVPINSGIKLNSSAPISIRLHDPIYLQNASENSEISDDNSELDRDSS